MKKASLIHIIIKAILLIVLLCLCPQLLFGQGNMAPVGDVLDTSRRTLYVNQITYANATVNWVRDFNPAAAPLFTLPAYNHTVAQIGGTVGNYHPPGLPISNLGFTISTEGFNYVGNWQVKTWLNHEHNISELSRWQASMAQHRFTDTFVADSCNNSTATRATNLGAEVSRKLFFKWLVAGLNVNGQLAEGQNFQKPFIASQQNKFEIEPGLIISPKRAFMAGVSYQTNYSYGTTNAQSSHLSTLNTLYWVGASYPSLLSGYSELNVFSEVLGGHYSVFGAFRSPNRFFELVLAYQQGQQNRTYGNLDVFRQLWTTQSHNYQKFRVQANLKTFVLFHTFGFNWFRNTNYREGAQLTPGQNQDLHFKQTRLHLFYRLFNHEYHKGVPWEYRIDINFERQIIDDWFYNTYVELGRVNITAGGQQHIYLIGRNQISLGYGFGVGLPNQIKYLPFNQLTPSQANDYQSRVRYSEKRYYESPLGLVNGSFQFTKWLSPQVNLYGKLGFRHDFLIGRNDEAFGKGRSNIIFSVGMLF